jgi:outer membrane lipopolysaccharide assembly protein LptE/RlpB
MTKHMGAILLLIMPAAVAVLSGCGGYTLESPYRQGIATVAVDMFGRGKDVYRREVETRATEAIVKRIEQDTPYKVTVKARADTYLTGTIETIEQRILSFDPDTGNARELELTLTVSFAWTDLRNGKTLAETKDLRVSGTYVREEPLTEDFYQGSENVVNRLAERVVEAMEAEW